MCAQGIAAIDLFADENFETQPNNIGMSNNEKYWDTVLFSQDFGDVGCNQGGSGSGSGNGNENVMPNQRMSFESLQRRNVFMYGSEEKSLMEILHQSAAHRETGKVIERSDMLVVEDEFL